MTEKTIAIVGAGFAGLAACWYLQQQSPQIRITLFDVGGVGGGASSIAAGLVHPFTGPEARVPSHGLEAFTLSRSLIQEVASQDANVVVSEGILRVALSERQQQIFRERSDEYLDLRLWTAIQSQERVPGLVSAPGLWIADGLVVDSQRYLHGLWTICESRGAALERESVDSLLQLSSYDVIVVACGYDSKRFPELAPLSIRGIKGQIIELAWPQDLPPLGVALNSDVYIIPGRGGSSCLVGATFERQFVDEQANIALAESELRPKAEALIPALRGATLLDCRAGVRATTPSRQPFAGHVSGRVWALTALGAKGLLYHAFLARQLAHLILR